MKKTEELQLDLFTMLAVRDQPIRTALDLFTEISCVVRAALPGDLAEKHMQKIRVGMGDLRRYFGAIWLDALPVEWLLAVNPEMVAKNTSSLGLCLDFRERVHRIRLVQFHACAAGFHAQSAAEMSVIEACAAQLRREKSLTPGTHNADPNWGRR